MWPQQLRGPYLDFTQAQPQQPSSRDKSAARTTCSELDAWDKSMASRLLSAHREGLSRKAEDHLLVATKPGSRTLCTRRCPPPTRVPASVSSRVFWWLTVCRGAVPQVASRWTAPFRGASSLVA